MSTEFCSVHPENLIINHCYSCQKSLCVACRMNLSHHYFCSPRCHYRFQLKKTWDGILKNKLEVFLFWNLLLTLGFVTALGYRWRTPAPREVHEASSEISRAETEPGTFSAFPLALDSLLALSGEARGEEASRNSHMLSLWTEPGWTVNIWRNDWPVASEIVTEKGDRRFVIPLVYGENRIRLAAWDAQQKLALDRLFSVEYRSKVIETLDRSIRRGSPRQRRVSLTFDGGAINTGAVDVLDILSRNQIQTTMFLSGQFIENYPELVLRMLNDGHEIANHTYDHPHLTRYDSTREHLTAPGVTPVFLQQQLGRTDSIFAALTGFKMKPYWRAPFGEYNRDIQSWAAVAGFMHIYWSRGLDTRDWISDPGSAGYQSPSEALAAILAKDNADLELNGGIVLMHLGTERMESPMYEMLPMLIEELRQRNFEIVNISKLISP